MRVPASIADRPGLGNRHLADRFPWPFLFSRLEAAGRKAARREKVRRGESPVSRIDLRNGRAVAGLIESV